MDSTAADDLLRAALAGLRAPVTLVSYTSDVESWYSRAERELLERVAAASDRITLEIRAERWDAAREAAAGIRRTPCLAVVGERDHGIHYYGLPDGYELETFLGLIRAVSERASGRFPARPGRRGPGAGGDRLGRGRGRTRVLVAGGAGERNDAKRHKGRPRPHPFDDTLAFTSAPNRPISEGTA
ncbi:MAG: hypothetical protein FJZ38_04260 [Candidatus Rokubacteria bacterium]|nr:hypothetical protein [Candidatus Rokubacteria bacterium]